MADEILNSPSGQDAIKGGVFFGSNLTPAGSFSNIPQTVTINPPTTEQSVRVKLTLEELKAALQSNAQSEFQSSNQALSDSTINKVITNATVNLLIDYRDIRNFVFFGSAYTELAFNVNFLIANYPYKVFTARENILGAIEMNTLNGGLTEIIFKNTELLFPATYSYKEDGKTNWPGDLSTLNSGFDFVDALGNRFAIDTFHAPAGISVTAATNATPIQVTTSVAHGFVTGDQVELYDIVGNDNANDTFYINVINSTNFELFTNQALTVGAIGSGTFEAGNGSRVRKIPLDYSSPYNIRFKVKGNVSVNNLIDYQDVSSIDYKGLVISPKLAALTDFNLSISPIQKQLLAPASVNPTPWPREPITNNIIITSTEFDAWVKSDTNFFLVNPNNPEDLDSTKAFTYPDVSGALNLARASTLDETTTNQLLRKGVPYRLVDEVHDTEDGYFQRFVLLAGQGFDLIKSYIDFLRYTKSVNYTPYNQLSPEFYKLYAEHYGFDLFDDESIDLAKLIVRTEPGLRYDSFNNPVFDDRANSQTLKQLQDEQQKRLLINLFTLYRAKGTQETILNLTSLLGAPKGLFTLREYAFQVANLDGLGYSKSYFDPSIPYSGIRIIDNDKVHAPDVVYEIDPAYLINPSNILDSVNKPYMYRLRASNYETHNLREISIYTDPQNAIVDDILGFGTVNYTYGVFGHRSYANLQDKNKPYYLLPLTFPDKYYGVTVEYMIPRSGYTNGEILNADDRSEIHIASLFQAGALNIQPFLDIQKAESTPAIAGSPIIIKTANGPTTTSIVTAATNATPILITANSHGLNTDDKVSISGIVGNVAANGIFFAYVLNANQFELYNTHTILGIPQLPQAGSGAYVSGGIAENIVSFQPHGYSTGDTVEISGVNPPIFGSAANGIFTIQNISPTEFALVGTTGNEAYVSGGKVRRLTPALQSITNLYTYPDTLGLDAVARFTVAEGSSTPITFASNAGPISINSNNHGLITGQQIRISGVLGNTAANGTWTVTVINTVSFTLNGSLGSGVYTSGGSFVTLGSIQVRVENYAGSGLGLSTLIASITPTDVKTTVYDIVNYINFNGSSPDYRAEALDNGDGTFTVKVISPRGSQATYNNRRVFVQTSGSIQVNENLPISSPTPILLSGGRDPVLNGDFIINKLEGRNLVTRIGFSTEVNTGVYSVAFVVLLAPNVVVTSAPHGFHTGERVLLRGIATSFAYPDVNGVHTITVINDTTFSLDNTTATYSFGFVPVFIIGSGITLLPFEERVAIYPDFFAADGLNHQLRLIYRPRGIEVYKDFEFNTFLPWLDPTTSINGPFNALNIPRSEILSCTPLLFPILDYAAYPDKVQDYPAQGDEPTLWDFFVGLPRSIDFNFLRVGVVESQTINLPNVIDIGPDPKTGYESEVYSFQFVRQTPADFNSANAFNIPAQFRKPNPGVPGQSDHHYLPTDANNLIHTLALHSHDYLEGTVSLDVRKQDFFTLPENALLTMDNIFKFNGWSYSIHEDYHYNALEAAFRNYEVFSNTVLTYSSLLPFLQVVEEKFKKLITQFIPIVINISDFGRIISPSPFFQPKVHYAQIHDLCTATTTQTLARAQFDVVSGTYNAGVNKVTIDLGAVITLAANIDFINTKGITAQDIVDAINSSSPYTILGNPVNITAIRNGATVIIEVNPNDYLTATGNDINDEPLVVTVGGDFVVANIKGWDGGLVGQIGDDCFKVTRTLPAAVIAPNVPFLYYDSENGPNTFLYFDSESIPPLFVYFDGE